MIEDDMQMMIGDELVYCWRYLRGFTLIRLCRYMIIEDGQKVVKDS
jgi:hypothetical protein